MKIQTRKKFDKHFAKRIRPNSKLLRQFTKRLKLYTKKPNHPLLKDHQLTGSKKHLRAFSITGNYRTLYQKINSKHIILFDVGTHNQVY